MIESVNIERVEVFNFLHRVSQVHPREAQRTAACHLRIPSRCRYFSHPQSWHSAPVRAFTFLFVKCYLIAICSDIACRNMLVDSGRVRVSDFGLSRSLAVVQVRVCAP